MGTTKLVSRTALARELDVETQTIAHWERAGWFPRPKMRLSLKRIFYDRTEVDLALDLRARRNRFAP